MSGGDACRLNQLFSLRGDDGETAPDLPVRVTDTGHEESFQAARSSDLAAFSHAQAQMIAGCIGEVLFDPEVTFRRLNRRMAERDLDLLEGGVALVREFREGPP